MTRLLVESGVQRTIHEANTTQWNPGDIIIHDADAKRRDMLLVILGRNKQGVYRTRYAFPAEQPKYRRRTTQSLHDPRRFEISLKGDPFARLRVLAVQS